MIYKIGKRRVKKSVYLRFNSRARRTHQVESSFSVYRRGDQYYFVIDEAANFTGDQIKALKEMIK